MTQLTVDAPSVGPSVWDRLMGGAAHRARPGVWILVTELFIGLGWMRAAVEKVINETWWTGDALRGFLAQHDALGWYEPFLEHFVAPNTLIVAAVVILLQLVAGATLLVGRHQAVGLAVGMFLNLHFIAAGVVNPSAFYLLSQGALALAIAERSRRDIARPLRLVCFGAATLGFVSLPFIRTVHPATVIDDPAAVLVTGASLSVLACELVQRRRPARSDAGREEPAESGQLIDDDPTRSPISMGGV